jgi:diketogulonate reductase-like aldo/keto reductase
MTAIPNVKLNDGHQIPQIGLGLWLVKDKSEFDRAFDVAIETGYRHFDSAQAYDNEDFLGEAWQRSGLKRDQLFLTTKIYTGNFGYETTIKSFDESLAKLKTDYVDLLLLHFPIKDTLHDSWRALEKIQKQGKARSIGVSNYTIQNLESMKSHTDVTPAVNQVELHVFLQQPELLKYCKDNNIVVEAYSPLAHAASMHNAVIREIAAKHGRTYAQIMLRWCLEKDLVVLPKSITPSRIAENFAIFDFALDADDMNKLDELDHDFRTCWDPETDPRADGVSSS